MSRHKNKHYVYTHSFEGVVFYVGQGNRDRTSSRFGRNEAWQKFVKNSGSFDVEVISSHTSKTEARIAEAKLIMKLQPSCNKTLKHQEEKYMVEFDSKSGSKKKVLQSYARKAKRKEAFSGSKLAKFIVSIGDKEAAKLFKVTKRAAQSWRLGDRTPSAAKAKEMVKKTKNHPGGPLSFEVIYRFDIP